MQTQIMAVMNLTPDSFSDGGQIRLDRDGILGRAGELIEQGATWLDLGGESTRPGATPVSSQEEQDRVLPALEWIKQAFDVKCSIDTSNPELMSQCAQLGADMLNDVRAFSRPGALEAASASGLPVVVMHMQGTPATMQDEPTYTDVVFEVTDFLLARVAACEAAGIDREKVVLDPGFGFGKTLEHNVLLFQALDELARDWPTLVGVSRKRMIGDLTGQAVDQRDVGSAVAAAMAAAKGARWVRVHNVSATRDAMAVMKGLSNE